MRALSLALLIVLSPALVACDALGIESASVLAARKEAEGKAVGGACRHAGRAIEDCYAMNRKVDKSSVFAGWREMNDYMRDNKIEAVAPAVGKAEDVAAKVHDSNANEEADNDEPKGKTGDEGKAEKSKAAKNS
jgi:hypothetical protein